MRTKEDRRDVGQRTFVNPQNHNNDKTIKTHRLPSILPAIRASAHPGARKRQGWQAQPSGLSREETRRLVLEMIG